MKTTTIACSLTLLTVALAPEVRAEAGDPLPVQVMNLDAQSAALETKLQTSSDKLTLHVDQHEEREPLVLDYAALLVEARRLSVEELLMSDELIGPPSRGHRGPGSRSARSSLPTLLFGGDPGPPPEPHDEDEDEDDHEHGEVEGIDLGDLDFVLFVVHEAIHSAEEAGLNRDFERAEELLHEAEEARESGDAATALSFASQSFQAIACVSQGRRGR